MRTTMNLHIRNQPIRAQYGQEQPIRILLRASLEANNQSQKTTKQVKQ